MKVAPSDAVCAIVASEIVVTVVQIINFIYPFSITGEDDDLDQVQDPEENPAVEAGPYSFFEVQTFKLSVHKKRKSSCVNARGIPPAA